MSELKVIETIEELQCLLDDFKNDLFEFVFIEPEYETGKAQYIATLKAAIKALDVA